MTIYCSEFNCEWEVTPSHCSDTKTDANILADELLESVDYGFDVDIFRSDREIFFLAGREIKSGMNLEHWIPVFLDFRNRYPLTFNPNEVCKAVDMLSAIKAKRITETLDLSDDIDIQVYHKIMARRNEIFKKHSLNPIL